MTRKRKVVADDGYKPAEITGLRASAIIGLENVIRRVLNAFLRRPASSATPSSAKPPKSIGRPREIEWREIDAEIAWRIVHDKPPRVRTQFRDQMLAWCSQTYNREAAPSAMLEAINVMCDRLGYGREP